MSNMGGTYVDEDKQICSYSVYCYFIDKSPLTKSELFLFIEMFLLFPWCDVSDSLHYRCTLYQCAVGLAELKGNYEPF